MTDHIPDAGRMVPPRCEPPPELRGVDGWHWVQWPEGPPQLLRWRYAPRMEAYGWTLRTYSTTADGATNAGWRYIAPVTPPAEVEALKAERNEALKFQGEVHRLRTGNKLLADTIRAWGWENRKQESNGELIGRALHEMLAEIPTLRARVEALEAALAFYAERRNYAVPALGMNWVPGRAGAEVENDGGSKARAALEGKPHD